MTGESQNRLLTLQMCDSAQVQVVSWRTERQMESVTT